MAWHRTDLALVNVTDSLFQANSARFGGGFASLSTITVMQLSNCSFDANSALFGGGGYLFQPSFALNPSNLTFLNFTNNQASRAGGGYFLFLVNAAPGTVNLFSPEVNPANWYLNCTDCYFANNLATYGEIRASNPFRFIPVHPATNQPVNFSSFIPAEIWPGLGLSMSFLIIDVFEQTYLGGTSEALVSLSVMGWEVVPTQQNDQLVTQQKDRLVLPNLRPLLSSNGPSKFDHLQQDQVLLRQNKDTFCSTTTIAWGGKTIAEPSEFGLVSFRDVFIAFVANSSSLSLSSGSTSECETFTNGTITQWEVINMTGIVALKPNTPLPFEFDLRVMSCPDGWVNRRNPSDGLSYCLKVEAIGTGWLVGLGIALGLAILACLALMVWIWRHQTLKQLKQFSPFFLKIGVGGGIGLLVAAYMWFDVNDGMCGLRPWLVAISFAVLYGAVILRQFRMYIIFRRLDHGGKSAITNTWLLLCVGCVVALEVLVLIIWFAILSLCGHLFDRLGGPYCGGHLLLRPKHCFPSHFACHQWFFVVVWRDRSFAFS